MFGEVKQMKKGIQIKEDIYWVGVRDFNNRHFHGSLYPIQEGATYNAYLVVDDEVTLFDTVEEEFAEEMLERIRSVIGAPSTTSSCSMRNRITPAVSSTSCALIRRPRSTRPTPARTT